MSRPEVFLLLTASLCLSGCVASGSGHPAAARWTTGFWFWQGSAVAPGYSGRPLDTLFVQVGSIRQETFPPYIRTAGRWYVNGELPRDLPTAREYWLVFRYERQGVPDIQVVPFLAQQISRLKIEARVRNLNVVGVQLDVDSPTSGLARYGAFLRELRRSLPTGSEISITALLDWFRGGTDLNAVIEQVDEFVPQFYDAGDSAELHGGYAIATPINAARWGTIFNRYHKRFRIGISSFGRARVVPPVSGAPSAHRRVELYGDLRPLDIATNPAFELQAARNAANEMVLSYRAVQETGAGDGRFGAGDTIQFVLCTPDAIHIAVQNARQIGGYLAGVIFFRWPASNEAWAMPPDEVRDAANGASPGRAQHRIRVVAGHCAAVECVDLYLETTGPLAPQPTRCQIRASTELQYFLPEQNVPSRLTGPSQIELSVPPYCARGHLYVGRAVSLKHAEFAVEEKP